MVSLVLSILIAVLTACLSLLVWYWSGIREFSCPKEPKRGYILNCYAYSPEEISLMEEKIDKKYQKELIQYEKECQKIYNQKKNYYGIRIFIIAAVVLFVCIGGFLGISYGFSQVYQRELIGYEAEKTTIEQSLNNKLLTGTDRFELVKQASELNKWLAQQKFDYEKWVYFDIDKTVKKAYKDAEYIDLNNK